MEKEELNKQRMKDAYENEQLRIQVAALTALTGQAPLNPAPLPPLQQAQHKD